MNYLIYKITNRLNNKIYVGKHKTENKDDGYLGSGLLLGRAVEKYGKENFVKEILFECSSEEEMNKKEADIVDEEFIARDDTYNVKLGGIGGFDYINESKLNVKSKEFYSTIGKAGSQLGHDIRWSDSEYMKEWKEKSRIRMMEFHKHNPNFFLGKIHTEETKKRMSLAKKGKFNGKKNPAYGKHWITNGTISKLIPKTDLIPDGFWKGRV